MLRLNKIILKTIYFICKLRSYETFSVFLNLKLINAVFNKTWLNKRLFFIVIIFVTFRAVFKKTERQREVILKAVFNMKKLFL